MKYASNNPIGFDSVGNNTCRKRILNLSGDDTEKSIEKAIQSWFTTRIPIRWTISKATYGALEFGEKIALKLIQKTSKKVVALCGDVIDVIDGEIGEGADYLPDFTPEYEKEDILRMAIVYWTSRKRTLEDIRSFFSINGWTLSKRQAEKVKSEIENRFPSLPNGKKIWEVSE